MYICVYITKLKPKKINQFFIIQQLTRFAIQLCPTNLNGANSRAVLCVNLLVFYVIVRFYIKHILF